MDDSSSSESDEEAMLQRADRVYRQRINIEIDDFKAQFRLSRAAIESILTRIGGDLTPAHDCETALSAKEQLLNAIYFLASGSFYRGCGDAHGVNKGTICRSLHNVVRVLNDALFAETVRFPTDGEANRVADAFFAKARMPQVCGAVDGTLIPIKAPSENEEQFVDRHGQHSINAMFVAGPDYTFLYADVNWPGAVSDSRVMRNSTLWTRFEHQNWRPFQNAIILGDSAYACNDWLIPCFPIPATPREIRFNRAHMKSRFVVENAFGIMKRRFPCLNGMRVKLPSSGSEIIKCCALLHNVCRREAIANNETDEYVDDVERGVPVDNRDFEVADVGVHRTARRAQLAATFSNDPLQL